ncbi:hypothetical protein BLA29_011788 [Euroglyphus maynei]|uniref:Uncharacterized protein n=1 Tax=Euroglyphus maynei TaxID=6958 RepID=A0A1Y3ANJ5_EURMA|nr:hypothetical protein BLA29_011788 [Euroglyphus maynei]
MQESIVASIVASALFSNILNLITLCANLRNNYFIVYLYCMLTLLHILIFALIMAAAHLRRIKREQFSRIHPNVNDVEY